MSVAQGNGTGTRPTTGAAYHEPWTYKPREVRVVRGDELTGDVTIAADVCVIGTGAGGAPVAKELAEGGMTVVMLETGEHFTTDDYTARPRDMSAVLYRDAGQTATMGNVPIVLPLGESVAGTTLVNSGTCFRTPDVILESWGERFGLDAMSPAELDPFFRRVEREVHVAQVPAEVAGNNALVVKRGAERLGWSGDFIFRNASGCVGSGVCNWGCPTSAKLHMGLTYVPRAWDAGAVTYTRTRAERLDLEGGRLRAVEARTKGGGRLRVECGIAIVACGTLYTLFYDGRQVSVGGFDPSLSYDGRFLAYTQQSGTSTFVVHVRDMRTGKDRIASSDGRNRAGHGYGAMISGNGRYVAFRSADVLVPRAGKLWMHVYVKDLKTKRIRLANVTAKGRIPRGAEALFISPFLGSDSARISADGRQVAFWTRSPLVRGDSGNDNDLYVKDMTDGGVQRLPVAGGDIFDNDFRISGNGDWLVATTLAQRTGQIDLYSLTGESPRCEAPSDHPDDGLDGVDLQLVKDGMRPSARSIKRAAAALAADTKAHPGNKAQNDALLSQLRAIQRHYGGATASASADDVAKLVDDAKCKLLEDGRTQLEKYLRDQGVTGDQLELVDTLSQLKDVLSGDISDKDKLALLQTNVQGFIERLGGKDAKERAKIAKEAFKLVKAHLEGNLTKEAKKKLKEELVDKFKEASKKYFGRDAPELVDRLLDLRDVLSGSVDDNQKAKMLEDSIGALAKKLLGEGILKTPQARAAMFGFELGRAFGERIAADLEIIASTTLARECAIALGPSQSTPGAIDYSKPASGTIPSGKALYYAGWRCDVLPEAFVEGSKGGLVQATRPADASRAYKALWAVLSADPVITYDPTYAR